MGIHTGEPSVGGEGYLGMDVVRAARICSAAHGGQVLVSESTRALVGGEGLEDLGLHHLKDMEHPERLFQLVQPGLPGDFPAPRTLDRPQPPPPALMAGRELELASRAAALAERFAGIGPTIDQHVRDALAARGIPTSTPPKPPKPQSTVDPRLAFAAFAALALFATVVVVVYLLIE